MTETKQFMEFKLELARRMAGPTQTREVQFWQGRIDQIESQLDQPLPDTIWLLDEFCSLSQQLAEAPESIIKMKARGADPLDRPPMPVILNLVDAISCVLLANNAAVPIMLRFKQTPIESILRIDLLRLLAKSGDDNVQCFIGSLDASDVAPALLSEFQAASRCVDFTTEFENRIVHPVETNPDNFIIEIRKTYECAHTSHSNRDTTNLPSNALEN